MRRKHTLLISATLLSLSAAPAQASPFHYADKVSQNMEQYWRAKDGHYGKSSFNLSVNQLTIFSAARLAGHQGEARKDQRIEPLARALITPPAYIQTPQELAQANSTNPHIPGFTTNLKGTPGYQHVAISAQAAQALSLAVESGALSPETQTEIETKISAVAKSRQFSYPTIEANQVNWPIMVWQAASKTNPQAAQNQIGSYLKHWVKGIKQPMHGYLAPNLSRGLGLNYYPESPQNSPTNRTSSTEYASVIYSGLDSYRQAVAQGMPRLKSTEEAQLKAWGRRIIEGEWTHGGWPNWDTGLGYQRWQLINYFAWCSGALVSIAAAEQLASPQTRQQAAYLFYRSLERFDWLKAEGMNSSTRYGIKSPFTRESDMLIAEARLGASAAKAGLYGIEKPDRNPGAWSYYDAHRKRLTVSTPAYSSAIITPNNKIGYGGMEPARLLDSHGRVLTSLGATPTQAGMQARIGRKTIGDSIKIEAGSTRSWRAQAGPNKTPGLRGQSGKLQAVTRFEPQQIKVSYRMPRQAIGRLRIPLWGELKEQQVKQTASRLVVQTLNDEAGKLTIIVDGGGSYSWQQIPAERPSPRSQTLLVIEGLKDGATVRYRPES